MIAGNPSIEGNPIVSAARRALPISREYDGGRFVTRGRGRRMLTPMFLVLVAIGTTDLLFALVSGLLNRLVYLAVGLSAILALIGVKLVAHSPISTTTRCRRSRPARRCA